MLNVYFLDMCRKATYAKEEFLRQSRISLLYSAAIEGKDRQKELFRAVGVQEILVERTQVSDR
jgi:hypothetical protein